MREPPVSAPPASAPPLWADFRLLIYLFIAFRLTMGLVYQPFVFRLNEEDGTPATVERGMSSFGDLRYFYGMVRLSDDGDWPYRDYWYEHPPVSTLLFLGVDRLIGLFGAVEYRTWAFGVGLVLLAADVANLILLRDLARRLHGEAVGLSLAWIYALLAAPLIISWWTFEPLVLLTILLALWALLHGRRDRSAAAAAVGILTKYTPVLILPAVWRFYPWRAAMRYTAITLLIAGGGFALMIAWGGDMAVSSLRAQFHKASYQTVWALLDGNMRTGRLGDLDTRVDADTALKPDGHAPVIPAGLRAIPFALAGGWIFTRRMRHDDRSVVAFFTLTVILFFLWAQGWSPQWTVALVPLILLNFPHRDGVLLGLLISFASFVEYPVLFMQTDPSDGAITGTLVPPYVLLILLRTALLAAVGVALVRQITTEKGAVHA